MFLSFCPNRAATPIILVGENNITVISRDQQQDYELAHTLFFNYDSPKCWKDPEEFWATVDGGCDQVPIPYAWPAVL
jgi:hypothetical protein